jgi:hypothetical protein
MLYWKVLAVPEMERVHGDAFAVAGKAKTR